MQADGRLFINHTKADVLLFRGGRKHKQVSMMTIPGFASHVALMNKTTRSFG